jgi:hypothetical protein
MERRLVISVLFAAALHALVYARTREATPSPSLHDETPPIAPQIDETLELTLRDLETAVPATPSVREDRENVATRAAPARVPARSEPPGSGDRAPSAPVAARPPEEVTVASPPGSGSPIGAPVTRTVPPLLDLDRPGAHAILLPPSASSTPEARAAKSFAATPHAHPEAAERARGGGTSGPVATAAQQSALGWKAPETGWAIFDVDSDANGVVVRVAIASASGDPAHWQAVRGDLATALQSKRLRVPSGAAGVRVRVRVDAEYRLPSGAKTTFSPLAYDVDAGHASVKTEFDVSDFGQSPKRFVRATVLDERRL